ncbi:hypothetical protein WJX72_008994 [[Myrmecia] bisecta]|uniref:Uncharacterized protein n=1 Tax=[Myrmecia] bisecta TaxID=41462 RepID=A0AAW1QCA3_9CHLO
MDGNRQGLLDLALPDLLAASDGVLRSWPTEYYRSNGKVLLLRVLSHFTEQCLLWVEAQADAGAVESAQQLRDDDQQDDVPDAVMAVARIVSAGRMSEAALQTERWGSEHPALQQWRKRTADATRKPIFEALQRCNTGG